ncbi:MAG: LON peptidase substrate-binding domain-containing protein [Candidatus Kapabacteria bacterium]|nr:LON peptidase substrate-binding domain-containing protein [Candidatus Kapabacteria bacterium]MCS7169120.1 LON peptidase substrate-binding domain-containing protein [Candidatus Kapabacteria bacterium]MDW7997776.1 LON peptidase substrate-binding domain-containing protein [Bacteroidota bacterium]MDW8225338.1 LON peptidase substrate-binding domain-containing protein [Bacteroidota bacterium]
MPERIALFPLEVVLLPGEVLPLHIFEPCYRLLIHRVMRGSERMGINLLLEGRFHAIGCLASIEQVLRRYQDGRMDVTVSGLRRYRARTVDEVSQPYWVAEVEWVEDEANAPDPDLRQACEQLYERLLLIIRGHAPEIRELIQEARRVESLSFYLGKQVGLDLLQRQHLLETCSEGQRLQWLQQHLQTIIPRLQEMEAFARRIRSNGHFP